MRAAVIFKLVSAYSVPLLLAWLVVPQTMSAQCNGTYCLGDNAVYPSGSGQVQSHSFIDASQFPLGQNGDICVVINAALMQLNQNTSYYGNKQGVIDARGVALPQAGYWSCGSNPWGTGQSGLAHSVSSTILLPAGTIQTSVMWVLPNRTRLIGQGACNPTSPTCTTMTIMQATSSLGSDMIHMGDPDPSGGDNGPCHKSQCATFYNCNGVSIEHLRLDGGTYATRGIVNYYSEELSYVNDVAMVRLTGTGLTVGSSDNGEGDGDNSGPYSNLYISTAGQCVQIASSMTDTSHPMNQTRGIHGLTCVTSLASGAAISIDAINNTIEDVSISGPTSPTALDGIELGKNNSASGNVLMNITGTQLTNVVRIFGNQNNNVNPCPGTYNACDITIAGLSSSGTGNTIEDDLPPGNILLSDSTVGLYVLGEPVGPAGVGMSRLTTSKSIPTWLVGQADPSSGACVVGDIYSNTSGANGHALYACTAASGTWSPIASH